MLKKTASSFISAAFILILAATSSQAAEPAAKKLQVFILAGQSNMVGHAHYITLPALLTAKEPGIGRVRDLVFKKDSLAVGDARAQVKVAFAIGIEYMAPLTMSENEVKPRVSRDDMVINALFDGLGLTHFTISVPTPLSVKISSSTA